MEVARLKTWCHHPGINLTRSLHGVVSGAPSIGSYGQEDVTARADQGTLLSLLKRIKEHFNSQMAFKKSMQLQGRWCILIHFSSFLNTFQKCFSEDVMNWLPLERGSQDKGSCQISSSYFRECPIISTQHPSQGFWNQPNWIPLGWSLITLMPQKWWWWRKNWWGE